MSKVKELGYIHVKMMMSNKSVTLENFPDNEVCDCEHDKSINATVSADTEDNKSGKSIKQIKLIIVVGWPG